MKRFVAILFVIILLIATIALVSCNQPSEPVHEHTFETIETKQTCSKAGQIQYTCTECDYVYCETIDADLVSHSFKEIEKVDPTCTNYGYVKNVCELCSKESSEILQPQHTMGDACVIKQFTCTEDGEERKYCDNCDYFEIIVVEAHHDETKTVKVETAPTCTFKGYTTYSCNECDYYETRDYVDELPHEYKDWTTLVEPTCTELGLKEAVCECGAKITENIEMIAHTYEEIIEVEPTCTELGLKRFVCDCGAEFTENIEIIDHKYEIEVIDPTDTATGYSIHKCVCGDSYIDTYVSTVGSEGLKFVGGSVSLGDCESSVVVIPLDKEGVAITTISYKGFCNNDTITTIYLTTNITEFSPAAFAYSENIKTFIYEGTMEQWNDIVKGKHWDLGLINYVVKCTDGEINK